MRVPKVHIVGAGFSGLSAAIHLSATSSAEIIIHERGAQSGGKRRTFHDETIDMMAEAGAFPLFANWRSTLALLETIGARAPWREAETSGIPFADMASGERWTLRPNAGRLPWWILSSKRRAPGSAAGDYLRARKLRGAGDRATLAEFLPHDGAAFERLWRPFSLAALNVEPARASARLAAAVLEEAFASGGDAARLLFPETDLGRAFVEPAERHLRKRGVAIRFGRDLRAVDFEGDEVAALEFETDRVDLAPGDALILAVPAWVAPTLVPGLAAPTEFTATLTAHFAISPPPGSPRALGVVNGPFSWMFARPDRIGVSVRDAEAWMNAPREELAAEYWRAVAGLTGLSDDMPPWLITRQKRAAFAATPEQEALRPPCQTSWRNLFLAGGYVKTGLPENIEGAVRSGEAAASWAAAAL
jgi:squalene-associated FAD-dependent desaturase